MTILPKIKDNVLLGLHDICGQAGILAHGLHQQGLNITYVLESKNKFFNEIEPDVLLPANMWKRRSLLLRILAKAAIGSQIIHFTANYRSLVKGNFDLGVLKTFGRKIVVQYHGCGDARLPSDKLIVCSECENACDVDAKNKRLELWARMADAILVNDPTLFPDSTKTFDKYHFFPVMADLKKIPSAGDEHNFDKPVKILHAPSNRSLKGTRYVIDAVERLKSKGLDVELRLIENLSNKEVVQEILAADIIVDQLLIGWYGRLSVEAMAANKIVVCYVDPEMVSIAKTKAAWFSDPPIINSPPQDIEATLEQIIQNPERYLEVAKTGREFVAKTHSIDQGIKRLKLIYQSL